jgi:hypothetical protein
VKRALLSVLLVNVFFVALAGCSPEDQEPKTSALRFALVGPYVDDEAVREFDAYLAAGVPDKDDTANGIEVVGVSTGDSAADPMAVMAGMTRIAAMLAAQEIEVWICDPETARRYAENGASYVPLDELFTREEISSFRGTPVSIPLTDDAGEPTGELSGIVGIDLSMNAAIQGMAGIQNPQVFVLVGSTNREAAKATVAYLARGQ